MTEPRSLIQRSASGILNSSPDGILLVDTDGRIADTNDRVVDLFGYVPAELQGEPIERLVPEDIRETHVAKRDAFLEDPELRPMGVGLDLSACRKDGSEFPVDVSLSPIEIEGDRYVIAVVQDISEQEALRAKYRSILETVPDAIFVMETSSDEIVEVNEQAARLLNAASGEIVGKNRTVLHPSGEEDRYREFLDEYLAHERDIVAQFPNGDDIYVETTDGECVPVEINAHVSEIGDRRLITGVFRDISARKEREQQVTTLHEVTRQLMEADERDAIARHVVDAANTILGYTRTVIRFVADRQRLEPVAVTDRARSDLGTRPDYRLDGENPPIAHTSPLSSAFLG